MRMGLFAGRRKMNSAGRSLRQSGTARGVIVKSVVDSHAANAEFDYDLHPGWGRLFGSSDRPPEGRFGLSDIRAVPRSPRCGMATLTSFRFVRFTRRELT
jgi:hypothetical protein